MTFAFTTEQAIAHHVKDKKNNIFIFCQKSWKEAGKKKWRKLLTSSVLNPFSIPSTLSPLTQAKVRINF